MDAVGLAGLNRPRDGGLARLRRRSTGGQGRFHTPLVTVPIGGVRGQGDRDGVRAVVGASPRNRAGPRCRRHRRDVALRYLLEGDGHRLRRSGVARRDRVGDGFLRTGGILDCRVPEAVGRFRRGLDGHVGTTRDITVGGSRDHGTVVGVPTGCHEASLTLEVDDERLNRCGGAGRDLSDVLGLAGRIRSPWQGRSGLAAGERRDSPA